MPASLSTKLCLFGLVFCLTSVRCNAQKHATPQNATPQTADIVVSAIKAQPATDTLEESDLKSEFKLTEAPATLQTALTEIMGQAKCLERTQVLIVHFASWTVVDDSTYALNSSNWYVYRAQLKTIKDGSKACDFKETTVKADDQPLLYGDKNALLIGFNSFDKLTTVSIVYKVSATPEKPENVQDLGMLVTAITGTSGKRVSGTPGVQPPQKLYIAKGPIQGYKRLPFDFNIGYSLAPVSPKNNDPAADQPNDESGIRKVPDGYVSKQYSTTLSGSGGKKTFRLSGSSTLPDGLSLYSSGTISGTPKVAVTTTFTVEIADGDNPSAKPVLETYKIRIASQSEEPPSTPAPGNPPDTGQPPNKPSKQQNSNQQSSTTVDCSAATSKSPCTFNRSLTSDDREWWDVGIGVTVPGVKEPQFSVSSGALQQTTKTDTNLYGMLDIYPAACCKNNESGIPHFNIGLPVSGQPFYRPYFGAAENFTSWTGLERLGFPIRMDVFAGAVYLRESIPSTLQIGETATSAQLSSNLRSNRVWKLLVGVEVPVSALVSKVGKKSTSKSSSQ